MRRFTMIWLILALIFSIGCAHKYPVREIESLTAYTPMALEDTLISKYAPVFLIENYDKTYDRIGQPSAEYEPDGDIRIFVDDQKPAMYYMKQPFSTDKGEYVNLVYRIHFTEVPFKLFPFHLTTGDNVGLMVLVTLDAYEMPVLVSVVHTCGCYLAIIPTSHLPKEAYPDKWADSPQKVYGERLPQILDYDKGKENQKLFVYIRTGEHRVMNLEIMEETDFQQTIVSNLQMPLFHARTLEQIPVNGKTTSFYHQDGLLKGHVIGAVKPWESLLLGLISLDFFVGTDKVYGDSKKTGNRFYTSLKPWNRAESDMWHFARFLRFWGWRL